MKYLKLFGHHVNYEGYIIQDGVLRPNVSHCVDQKCVHYNPTQSVITAIINTADYERIVGNEEVGDPVVSANLTSNDGGTSGVKCYHNSAGMYYYKKATITQRTDGELVRFPSCNIMGFTDDVVVTYSAEKYEQVKYRNESTILLTQDGTFVSGFTYCGNNSYQTYEYDWLPQFSNGEPVIDQQTGEDVPYTGKYDVEFTYPTNIIGKLEGDTYIVPVENGATWTYIPTVYQNDGTPLPYNVGVFFSEQEFLDNYTNYYSCVWLDRDGTLKACSVRDGMMDDPEIMVDGENYATVDVMPKFQLYDDGLFPEWETVLDENNNLIYYNEKYIIKEPKDLIPFSSIKINGEDVDLDTLIGTNQGFYEFNPGTYTLEYTLKNRKKIPEGAFANCVAFEDISIPKRVKEIKSDAFSFCPLLDTDEETIMRICTGEDEPIVVEADFDFEEGEEKILQEGTYGVFYYDSSEQYVEPVSPKKKKTDDSTTNVDLPQYFVINNGVVADVNCDTYDPGDIK